MDWRHRSACLDEDPELFFPIGNTGPAILQIEEAKQVCRRCDVREQCLAWALEAGQDHGVWGGLSEDERRALEAPQRARPRPLPPDPLPGLPHRGRTDVRDPHLTTVPVPPSAGPQGRSAAELADQRAHDRESQAGRSTPG